MRETPPSDQSWTEQIDGGGDIWNPHSGSPRLDPKGPCTSEEENFQFPPNGYVAGEGTSRWLMGEVTSEGTEQSGNCDAFGSMQGLFFPSVQSGTSHTIL